MNATLNLYLQICRLRANPQDLPTSARLLWLGAVAAVITAPPTSAALPQTYTAAALQVALLGVFVHTLLRLQNHPERWIQTGSAVFGTSAIINVLAWPVVFWYFRVEGSSAAMLPALLGLALSVWSLAIMAHILRNALEVGFGAALLISVGCMLLLIAVTQLLVPGTLG